MKARKKMKVIRLLGYALPVGPLIALGLFVHWFEPFRVGWLVDGLWLLAQILWVLTIRISSGPIFPETRPSWLDLLPIAIILLVLVPTWLPFYDNWRWAYTGDSIAWYGIGWDVATHGLRQDILNLHGVDDNFTYLHCIAFNSL